jgi:uncharacterized membrane protein YfhO
MMTSNESDTFTRKQDCRDKMNIGKNRILKLVVVYLLLLAAAISMHAYFIYNHVYFNEANSDSVSQISHFYPFLQREFSQGNFFWSWKYGLGGDLFAEFLYYYSVSPFFWLTMLFKISSIQQIYELRLFISIFKHALLMIFMYHLLRYWKRSHVSSIIGSFIYGGSLYFTLYSFRLDFMVDGCVWLPLLLLGYERFVEQKKKGLFIFMVFLMTCSNFYLAYINSIYLLIYAVVKYFLNKETYSLKGFFQHVLHTIGWYMVGLLLSAFTLLPAVYTYLRVDRFYDDAAIPLLFKPYFYKLFLGDLFFFIKPTLMVMVFPIIVYFVLFYGFFIREKQTRIRFLFTGFMFLLLLLPFSYSFFNGLSAIQYRWQYLFMFTVAHVFAFILDDLREKKPRFTFLYFSLLLVLFIGISAYIYKRFPIDIPPIIRIVAFSIGIITGVLLMLMHKISRKWGSILLIGVVFFNISFTNLVRFYAYPGNPQTLQTRQQDFLSSYAQPRDLKMFQDIREEDPTFYRIVWDNALHFNTPMLYDYYGFSAYNSLLSGLVHKFVKSEHEYDTLQLNMPSAFKNLNHRLYLETALANKYYVVPIASSFRPYGYSLFKQTDSYRIFKNEHALPIGFLYDAVVDKRTFATLNFGQRDQLLLQAAVVENAQQLHLPILQPKKVNVKTRELNKNHIQLKNATLDGSLLTIHEQAELILPNLFTQESGEVLIDIKLRRVDRKRYNLYVDDQKFAYAGDKSIYNYLKKEIVFHLDDQQKRDKITIKLSPTGEYELKGITLTFNAYKDYLTLTKARSAQSLQNVQFTEQSVSGRIDAHTDGILFLSIPYSEGWHIKVDGVATQALKVNSAFIGVPVTKGTHHVEMVYTTPYLRLGTSISVVTLIFLGLYTLRMRKKR